MTHDRSAVEEVEAAAAELRSEGRAAMGVTGDPEIPPLRSALQSHSLSWTPLIALSLLVIVDEFQRTALTVLGPEIAASFGISRATFGLMVTLSLLMVFVGTLPAASAVQRHPRRAVISVATAIGWSLMTIWSAFVRVPAVFAGILMADGATTGSVQAVHQPLLFDAYPPETRVRVLGLYRAADYAGRTIAPALVALTAGVFAMTWRGTLLVMGLVSLAVSLFAIRLRDPGFGRWDTDRIGSMVHDRTRETVHIEDAAVALGFFEIVKRLFLIPTVRRLLVVYALLGMMITPLLTYLAFFLQERFRLGPGARGLFSATTPLLGVMALLLAGRYGERLFRRDPSLLVRRAAWIFGAGVAALLLGVLSPSLAGTWLGFGVMNALVAAVTPALAAATMGIIPPRMRPHATALSGIFLFGVGGLAGILLLGGFDRRFGISWAILALAVPAALAMVVLHSTGRTINADLDRMVAEIIEEEEIHTLTARGVSLPLLSCRGIDFSYGQVQVLFNVSLNIDEGEVIALLGTNGAGKSTLLRVISGLGLPQAGSVRLRGRDITFLDPARRVRLGITQIPGGKAVFPGISVAENLRAFGFSLGGGRQALDRGLEECFAAFPRLEERRNQPAGTLSGGEAQMLALSKAFLLRPQLLLIDELSLGLAPIVVGQLLEMVKRINDEGAAVVIVEQSVNVALAAASHAYFMEKGEIRFDGPAKDLLAHDELLRSVFLAGAATGITS